VGLSADLVKPKTINWYLLLLCKTCTFHLYVATFQQHLHMGYIDIYQLIRYSRACCFYQNFFDRERVASDKEVTYILNQAFLVARLKSSLRKFYIMTCKAVA
jgi:hypothetical protein